MSAGSGWLISVFGMGFGMTALWIATRARTSWQKELLDLRAGLTQLESSFRGEVTELRKALNTFERGMVGTQESLRAGRLNLSVRSQALQMLRGGEPAETVASSLGIATSEARLLSRVGRALAIQPESQREA